MNNGRLMTKRLNPASAACMLVVAFASHPLAALAQTPEMIEGRTPNQWLSAMNESFSSLAYDGTFSYFNGVDFDTLRVVRKEIRGVERERLVHLNGPPREIVRTGDAVECIMMRDDTILGLENIIPGGPFARAFTREFDSLSDIYTLSFHGEGRIAGRAAVRLAIQPRDTDRYGYRLWIDRENQMLLRSEMVSPDQDFLEVFQFTHLVLGDDVADSSVMSQASEGSVVSLLTLETAATDAGPRADTRWRARWMPDGFAMATADVRRTNEASINTLMYSDGLAAFSVFIEDMPASGGGRMVTHRGPTVMVMDVVQGPDESEYLVTVVGDVPADTAQRIARSVSYLDG